MIGFTKIPQDFNCFSNHATKQVIHSSASYAHITSHIHENDLLEHLKDMQ